VVLDARALLQAVLLAGAVVALFALGSVWRAWDDWLTLVRQVDGGLSAGTVVPPSIPRVADVGSHPNILGAFFAMTLPAVPVLWLESRSPWERVAIALAGALVALALLFTLSRAAWGAAVVALMVTGAGLIAARGGLHVPRRAWIVAGVLVALLSLAL